ncbi:MAG: type III-A CRISPR-associated protein Cas10/Csm1 [Thermoplasmata archaeon]
MSTKEEDKVAETIRMAALLHDIGKFVQRAGELAWHEDISAKLLRPFVPANLLDEKVVKAIQFHHHERRGLRIDGLDDDDKEILKIVQLADRWDSRQRDDLDDPDAEKGSPTTTPLSSFFSKEMHYPVVRFYLPYHYCKPSRNPPLDYKTCKAGFEEGLAQILTNKNVSAKTRIGGLLELLKEYTYFVPSYTQTTCQISLYHHLKSTCAMAHAIYLWKEEKGIEVIEKPDGELEKEEIFLLVCGDFVGIQNFIYTIKRGAEEKEAGKGFGKRLRGRSLLVQMVQYFVVNYLLEKLGLGQESIVYCSGGNFAILAPNIKSIKEKLDEAEREITQWCRENLEPLGVVIATIPFSANNIPKKEDETWEIWTSIGQKLGEKKLRRDRNQIENLFELEKKVGATCSYCGAPKEKNAEKCGLCEVSEILGEIYNKPENLVMVYGPGRGGSGIKFNDVGVEIVGEKMYKPKEGDVCKLLANQEKEEAKGKDWWELVSIEWLLENIKADAVPSRDYRPIWLGKSFDALTSVEESDKPENEGEEAKSFLGYLLMDVDSLGEKLKKEIKVLSHLSAFSGELDLFFTRGLDYIIGKELGRKNVYVVYSGGDDLFAVARWDKAIALAEKVQKEFSEFFGNQLTISAGISLARPRYPIYGAARMVKEQEKIGKGRKDSEGKPVKNAVGIFDGPLDWDGLREALEFGNKIGNCEEISSSFLYQLLFLFTDKELPITKRNGRIAYQVARHFVERKPEVNKLLEDLKDNLCQIPPGDKADKEEYHKMVVALSYALLKRRLKEKEEREVNKNVSTT